MVSGITIEASIDNVHARSEMLLFCSSSVPHNRLLIFSDMNSLYPEHAYGLSHICPASLILWRGAKREEHSASSTGIKRSVPLSVPKTWETEFKTGQAL